MQSISYAELHSLWKRSLRNGTLRRMPLLKRGLFSATLEYTRRIGTIINPKVIGMIMALAERVGKSVGRKIFVHGLDRALGFIKNTKMACTFPTLGKWISENNFIFWLGTEILVNQRAWIYC